MEKDTIYQIMNGYVDSEQLTLPETIAIVDEFDENRECGKLYEKVYAAKVRMEERFGEDAEPDIEEIISSMEKISEILAMKMYQYGAEGRAL